MTNRPQRIESPEAFAQAFDVSRETLDRLRCYADLLQTWQRTINLVARSTLDDIWHRHMADSAQLFACAQAIPSGPAGNLWIDLGSGAGFPGLVLAIMHEHSASGSQIMRSHVVLIESDQRKCAFLREVARQTSTPVEIINSRIEDVATHASLPPAAVVSARALAPLPNLLSYAAPLLASEGRCLFLKGRNAQDEVAQAREAGWSFAAKMRASLTGDGTLCVIDNIAAHAA
ncbi:MAG: 16S rRNA (guanine(527)-N(7))-methyltransferase RsmG [Pseudomonadota bacterium]